MGFNLGGFGGAGGGADMLQQILAQAFREQVERKRAKQEDARITIDRQRADDGTELRKLDQEARELVRQDRAKAQAQTGALKMFGQMRPKDLVTPDQIATANEGGMGDKIVAPTLDSRNIGAGMASTPNPGRGASFSGLPDQLDAQAEDAERERQATLRPELRGRLEMMGMVPRPDRKGLVSELMREDAKPDTKPLYRIGRDGKPTLMGDLPANAATVNEPAPSGASHGRFTTVQGSDANGKPAIIRTNVDTGDVSVLPMPDGVNFAKREQPATQDQSNLALFANRVEQADPILSALTPNITKRNPAIFASQQWLDQPMLQDKELQQYQQAARNLINAVLRRESGAAISASEFAEARKQYLPVPGDDDATLAQKAETRRIVRENYKRSAGPAYKPMSAAPSGFKVVEIK